MPRLFHVSDLGPFEVMSPRAGPVWAIDEAHLVNYLLPRECPRVCWVPPAGAGHPLLGSPARRVVAVEHCWVPRLTGAGLSVHELDPAGFTLRDANAGYWVCTADVRVRAVRRVDDCFAALAARGAELRLTASLHPYVAAVLAAATEFSSIRMRNASP